MNVIAHAPPAAAIPVGAVPAPAPPSSHWGRYFAYLYFTRFSLLLWFSMPAFVYFDWFTGTGAATRGILTQANWAQCYWAAFLVVIAGWVALLAARIICAYGEERFGVIVPDRFRVGNQMSVRVFVLAQVPGLMLLGYSYYRTHVDGMLPAGITGACFLAGAVTAVLVWYMLALFYYWIYPSIPELIAGGRIDFNEAQLQALDAAGGLNPKAFAAPVGRWRWLDTLTYRTERPAIAHAFDGCCSVLARILGQGFCRFDQPAGDDFVPLHTGPALAVLVMAFLSLLYFVFFYFSAPVPMPKTRVTVALVIGAMLAVWAAFAIRHWAGVFPRNRSSAKRAIVLSLVLLSPVWGLAWIGLRGCQTYHRFPVLGLVYILIMFGSWGLSGLSFVLDRARIPVLGTIIVVLMAEHWVAGLTWLQWGPFGQGEHIVSTLTSQPVSLAQPQEILRKFQQTRARMPGRNAPLIIVTATGGGIHAGAWTSSVLVMLEQQFATDDRVRAWNAAHPDRPVTFHNSIVLMSSVSGGSFGVDSWLREYEARDGFRWVKPENSRVVLGPECSSLEAVAWGLLYPDIFHLLFPFRAWQTFDRGWALQAAVDRNRKDKGCGLEGNAAAQAQISLATLARSVDADTPRVPAVAMNSTIAETGDRFLLANYKVPFFGPRDKYSELLPASSFLDVYSIPHATSRFVPPPAPTLLTDLPLTAAARLSASFPYVSPMARVPRTVTAYGYHFGDGGYYDNDGTGSAMEFLHYGYHPDGRYPEITAGAPPSNPQLLDDIVLVEIRDSSNPYADNQPDSQYDQDNGQDINSENRGKIWGSTEQGLGPFEAFYNAGHASITRRNRRELCMLESALRDHVRLQHFVFDFQTARKDAVTDKYVPQPLNWHLTKADIDDIGNRVQAEQQLGHTAAETFAKLVSGEAASWGSCSLVTDARIKQAGASNAQ